MQAPNAARALRRAALQPLDGRHHPALRGRCVLEIGAGIGNLTRALVRGRKRYVATDISPEHLSRLTSRFPHRLNLEVHCCDLTRPQDFAPFSAIWTP